MSAIRISIDKAEKFVANLLHAGGFTSDEATQIATSLILSEISGHGSHGIIRVKEYLHSLKQGSIVSGAALKIIKETANSLLIDGQTSPGQVVMPAVLKRLMALSENQAIVSAAIYNSGHIGRIGEWVEKPAYAGLAAFLTVNDNGTCFHVSPPGGAQSVTSTNPLAFAIPLENNQIYLSDMATSAIAFGKVKLAKLNGTAVAPECIQDSQGRMTTDPNALFADPPGSIMPMGGQAQGYKGFALSMFVDMLTAGLSGGETPPATKDAIQKINNVSLTLWNPKFFAGLAHMQKQAQKYIDYVRAAKPADPAHPIRLSGDRTQKVKDEARKNGIALGDGLAQNLAKMANELGVAMPDELSTIG